MSRHVPTVEDYEAALKRFLILVPLVFVFCAVVGFIVGTLVAGKGLIGAGLAQIVLVWAIPALDRFGGPSDKKYQIAKQLREQRHDAERENHQIAQPSRPTDAFAAWQKYLLAALGTAVLFALVFLLRSGEPGMAAIGFVMGLISGPVTYRYATRSNI